MDYFSSEGYKVTLYTSLYMKHASKVEKLLNDGRRNKKSICAHILEIFNNIAKIVEKAQEYGFSVKDASKGVTAIEEDGTGTE